MATITPITAQANKAALNNALALCTQRITTKATHSYYDRVTKWADLYERLITGEDFNCLLQDIFGDIDTDELKRLKKITFPITRSVCNALMFAFAKVLRTEPIYEKIDFETDPDGKKKQKVDNALANYYGGKDLDFYIEQRVHDIGFTDPNAFVVTEFKGFDANIENAKPYPFEVSSKEAVNYLYDNNVLQFLLVENEIKTGIKLYLYLPNDTITFTQVPFDETAQLSDEGYFVNNSAGVPVIFIYKKYQFAINYYFHKTGQVPAIRVGYVWDKKTKGQTFVNPFHYGALSHLMKSIKSVAEMDITASKHAFPQKIAYVEGCSFNPEGICGTSGQRVDQCTICGKKGYQLHGSSKDIITFKMPRNTADLINLDQLLVYKYPPVEGLTWMKDYVNELADKCYKSVFNSEVFNKDLIVNTATQKTIELQNVYDVLKGYASKIADFWQQTVMMVAVLVDVNDAIVTRKYPNDFKLKNLSDLLNDISTATNSGAPAFVRGALMDDVAAIIYADKPTEYKKYQAQGLLVPFPGKSKDEILMAIQGGLAAKIDSVAWLYFDQFCNELEGESLSMNVKAVWASYLTPALQTMLNNALSKSVHWFYDMPFELQQALLTAKASAKLQSINAETPAVLPYGAGGDISQTFNVADMVTVKPGQEADPAHLGQELQIAAAQPSTEGGTYDVQLPDGRVYSAYSGNQLMLA